MADRIEPGLVVEAGRFHQQRVAIPVPHRISQPGGLRYFVRKVGAVGLDLAMRAVGFVHNHGRPGRLNDLIRVGNQAVQGDAKGQAVAPEPGG